MLSWWWKMGRMLKEDWRPRRLGEDEKLYMRVGNSGRNRSFVAVASGRSVDGWLSTKGEPIVKREPIKRQVLNSCRISLLLYLAMLIHDASRVSIRLSGEAFLALRD
ncbi:hypothetical protein BU16DRAFT_229020 [Lophium mytilinum]|uniref:Uncharacterized protein n=1 Tax=Lophium mytilinum TaxID=390894 RepID=A0A6A6QA90_9PEZI|nr:hypothetical protein BU16DRAFT_229020 [Lophium mytilinum]